MAQVDEMPTGRQYPVYTAQSILWCPGDIRRQGTRSHTIDQVRAESISPGDSCAKWVDEIDIVLI